jgi:signal-transduction protein with cAMP-binding, CBS, and nucleotidyltransferase domain
MPIFDLCSKKPVTIQSHQSLREAAQVMKKKHVGTLIVADSKGESPIGIVTDRDLVVKAMADGNADNYTVKDVMTSKLVSAKRGIGVFEAIELMQKKGVRRLVVVDESDQLCGMISTDDLVPMLGQEITGIGKLYESQMKNESHGQIHRH